MPVTKQKPPLLSSLAVQHGWQRLPGAHASGCQQMPTPHAGASARCPRPGRLSPQLAAFLKQLRTVLAVLHQTKPLMFA